MYGFNLYYSEYLKEPDEMKNHGSETNVRSHLKVYHEQIMV